MTRIIDDRGRLFGKINIVDLLVLLVVIALAVFVGLRATRASVETVPVKISFLVMPTQSEGIDAYTTLGQLKDVTGRTVGTIETAEVVQPDPVHFGYSATDSNLYVPTAPQVLLVVSSEASVFGSDIHVGSIVARVGTEARLIGPGWEGHAQIVKVDRGTAVAK